MAKILLNHDEQIISEIGQRVTSFMWQWMSSLFLLLVAAVGLFWFFRHGTWGIIGFSVLCLAGVWGVATVIIRAKGTMLVITTERVIDIAKDGIFGKTVSEVDMRNIEDVAVRQRGLWRMILKYGTIEIRIKDSKVKIVVDHVSRPVGVQRLINELRRQNVGGISEKKYSFENLHKAVTVLEKEELMRLRELIETKLQQLR